MVILNQRCPDLARCILHQEHEAEYGAVLDEITVQLAAVGFTTVPDLIAECSRLEHIIALAIGRIERGEPGAALTGLRAGLAASETQEVDE